MKSLAACLCLGLMCIAMNACTSVTALEPQSVTRDTANARIYFIRPSSIISSGQTVGITVNGKEVGSLGIGTFMHIDRPAGQYRVVAALALDFGQTEVTLNVAPQKDYYFKIFPAGSHVAAVGSVAAVSNKLGIAEISEAEAKSLMREMAR